METAADLTHACDEKRMVWCNGSLHVVSSHPVGDLAICMGQMTEWMPISDPPCHHCCLSNKYGIIVRIQTQSQIFQV